MQQDWSDAWLQQAAGWKAVKEGSALFRHGHVITAQWEQNDCRGTIAGPKPRRVTVKRISASIAETVCSCAENRRTGAMCEHAVAIIMAAREGGGRVHPENQSKIRPTAPQKTISEAKANAPALGVSLSPQWEKEWKLDRLTIQIQASPHRVSDESDERLFEWAMRMGLSQQRLPWQLQLNGSKLEDFLDHAIGHSEIKHSNETIVCISDLPDWHLDIEVIDDGIIASSERSDFETLGQRKSRWLKKNNHLFQSTDRFWVEFFNTLISEKKTKITDLQQLTKIARWQTSLQKEGAEQNKTIACQWIPARWKVSVEGSWRELRLRYQKYFEVGNEIIATDQDQKQEAIAFQAGVCFLEDDSSAHNLPVKLQELGWTKDHARNVWKIDDEESVIRFLTEGRDILKERYNYEESAPLQEMIRRLSIVKPCVEAESGKPDSWRIGFVTHQGKALDPDKIKALLKSNKRIIQTSDGQSVILPKESWEVFERSMADLGWRQSNVGFNAPAHHESIILYLRQYFDKTLKTNDKFNLDSHFFDTIQADFRPYQKQGVCWLEQQLERSGFALLADDMGLGKTLQTIALLANRATIDHPALVVVPTSLLKNWEKEIARFAPQIKTIVYHGSERASKFVQARASVIVTSYGVLANDRAVLSSREYSLVVLDEAGAIRNPDTDVARACFRIRAKSRLALTGTPLENRLTDLWSIFQFLLPGHLGPRELFRETYERPGTVNTVSLQSLKIRVMPFVLRRTKEEVAGDLPEKIEIDQWCEMSPEQWQLYESVRDEGLSKIEQELSENRTAAHFSMLTLLLRLRQICCDAALVAPECEHEWSLAQRSPKMERLFELITETVTEGRKMLVFSQFAKQLHLIERECVKRDIVTLKLDGATQNRQALVDRFQSDEESQVFLISLKAGGYGLNLTRASTVVHFDPWWNPAAERQASDRAHRIGQTQTVTIHRLLTQGTVEDRVRSLQQQKSQMADEIFSGQSIGAWQQEISSTQALRDFFAL